MPALFAPDALVGSLATEYRLTHVDDICHSSLLAIASACLDGRSCRQSLHLPSLPKLGKLQDPANIGDPCGSMKFACFATETSEARMSNQRMNQVRASAAAVLAISGFVALPSYAAQGDPNPPPSYCNNYAATVQGPGAPALNPVGNTVLNVGDMSFNGASADNCYGVVATQGGNNDSAADLNALNVFGQNNWTFVTKADVGSGPSATGTGNFGGYGFTLTTDVGKLGDWTLEVTSGGPLPAYFDIIGTLKGAPGYALYLFDDVTVNLTNTGDWKIQFKNNGNNIPDLSHLSIYMRVGEDGGGSGGNVPEPASLALLGLGLLGMTLVRRRKS